MKKLVKPFVSEIADAIYLFLDKITKLLFFVAANLVQFCEWFNITFAWFFTNGRKEIKNCWNPGNVPHTRSIGRRFVQIQRHKTRKKILTKNLNQ